MKAIQTYLQLIEPKPLINHQINYSLNKIRQAQKAKG